MVIKIASAMDETKQNWGKSRLHTKHCRRIKLAKAKVDNKAPILPVDKYISPTQLEMSKILAKTVYNHNKSMVQNLNYIYRTEPTIDTGLVRKVLIKEPTNFEIFRKETKTCIDKYNKVYFKLIREAESYYTVDKIGVPEEFKRKVQPPLKLWTIVPPDIPIKPKIRKICYFDITIKNFKVGRIEIELYNDIVPKTCMNFMKLCEPEERDRDLKYEKSIFYRVIPGLFCLGGDVINNSGTGYGKSAYGDPFPDENYELTHNGPGVLSMYKTQGLQNTYLNDSHFLITFRKLSTLDKKYVVFGRIIKSLRVLEIIEGYGTRKGKPKTDIIISNCGAFK